MGNLITDIPALSLSELVVHYTKNYLLVGNALISSDGDVIILPAGTYNAHYANYIHFLNQNLLPLSTRIILLDMGYLQVGYYDWQKQKIVHTINLQNMYDSIDDVVWFVAPPVDLNESLVWCGNAIYNTDTGKAKVFINEDSLQSFITLGFVDTENEIKLFYQNGANYYVYNVITGTTAKLKYTTAGYINGLYERKQDNQILFVSPLTNSVYKLNTETLSLVDIQSYPVYIDKQRDFLYFGTDNLAVNGFLWRVEEPTQFYDSSEPALFTITNKFTGLTLQCKGLQYGYNALTFSNTGINFGIILDAPYTLASIKEFITNSLNLDLQALARYVLKELPYWEDKYETIPLYKQVWTNWLYLPDKITSGKKLTIAEATNAILQNL